MRLFSPQVASLQAWGGEPMERRLRRWGDGLGWLVGVLLVLVLLLR
jgi:hypothetical protein